MPDFLFHDTETYSTVPIGVGLDQYFTVVEPLIHTYALNDEPVECWDITSGVRMPAKLEDALRDERVIKVAHNSQFDHGVVRHGYNIVMPYESTFCTMACAYAHALPGSLEVLGPVLGLAEDRQKLARGSALIQLFCKPQRGGKRNTDQTHSLEWAEFLDYAVQDTVALREIFKRLPKHNYRGEHFDMYVLDAEINQRGFCVDLDLCRAAVTVRDEMKEKLEREVTELTDGKVERGTQVARIKHHMLGEYSFIMLDMQKDTIKKLLEGDDLEPDVRRLLELRRDSALSSLTKYERALERAGPDGRMRYTLQFSGAGRTGRWAGRGFQPHNMPRPRPETNQEDIEQIYIPAILDGTLPEKVDDVNQCCADTLRSTIIAAPEHELLVGDWSNIEGVCNAWEAKAEWKLEAFRENYFGGGPDMYVLLYARSFGIGIDEVSKAQRQMGKGMELSMGYGGGVGAFVNVASSYGLDIPELGSVVPSLVSDEIYKKAYKAWERAFRRGEDQMLEPAEYIACDALKQVWRKANPEIVQMWWDVERACQWAIERPGSIQHVARCRIWRTPAWLIIELPSGRRLLYAQPAIKTTVEYDEDTDTVEKRSTITYMAATAKQWRRERTYGGKIVENITQAIANDVLRAAMLRADAAGYPLILHVHDEMVAEVLKGLYDLQDFLDLMQEPVPWAPDLPLKAAGYVSDRYRKD